jgi:UDP-2,4-diacetamido-2,4,6-trideoxy-beta-L-altropyranose hydrolase
VKVAIRADGSVEIGTGHVMRCLAIGSRLIEQGADVRFLCVQMLGHLVDRIVASGMEVRFLAPADALELSAVQRAVADWVTIDLLVVDHYGLDKTWETGVRSVAKRVMVIDDSGRSHDCHMLLDQNYPNPIHDLYLHRIPAGCELLLGPQYALLRPEFAALRAASLSRSRTNFSRLLIFMGGGDPGNETTKVLHGIGGAVLAWETVDVVIGAGNPHLREVQSACVRLPNATLHIQTSRMAELMSVADCAICAAGSTTWERCALGLPALVTILAANQAPVAEAVAAAGGHQLLGWHDQLTPEDYADALLKLDADKLCRMSQVAAGICDGRGAERVATRLTASSRGSEFRSGKLYA